MGELTSFLPNDLVVNYIWPFIVITTIWQELDDLFHKLCLCDKYWKNLVDNSNDWKKYQLHLHYLRLDRKILEEHKQISARTM